MPSAFNTLTQFNASSTKLSLCSFNELWKLRRVQKNILLIDYLNMGLGEKMRVGKGVKQGSILDYMFITIPERE